MPSPLRTTDRPTNLRLRADLVASRMESGGATRWIVKDPLTLEHFQFSAEEYALMDWLREPVTLAELSRRYAREFAPRTISPQAVWEFMSRLHAAGLLMATSAGQGHELLERRERDRFRRWSMAWTGLLGIRFRGVDPDRFLNALHDRCRWLFSSAAFVASVVVVLYALAIVVGHLDEFRARLPELSALVDWRNLPWLLAAIGFAKVLHELGHALVCKHFGGEVRELGFMLLVFAPCLYCDVSDAWRLRGRWQRIAVSAAGVIVELVLAAIATIVWWHARPGIVQLVALNLMLICTLHTLVVNANPLLRYDGYYILSDLVGVPNLWQRSREVLRLAWSRWICGEPANDDPLLPRSRWPWLALYAVASKAYLLVVSVLIVWGLARALAPHHLQNLAYGAGFIVLGSALAAPVRGMVELARNPIRRGELRPGRVGLLTALGAAFVVIVLAFPVEYEVTAPLVLMPTDAERVCATVEGTLESIVPTGSRVAKGDAIATLTNVATELELAKLEGECKLRALRVEHLEKLRGLDRKANDGLPTARTALADSERRLAERRREAGRLVLVAPTDGVVIAAPRTTDAEDSPHALRLASWSGSLFDSSACGAFVEPRTLVCLVGDPRRVSAVMLASDADARFIRPGQRARLKLDALPGGVLEGHVVEVANHALEEEKLPTRVPIDLSVLRAGLVPPGQEGPCYEVRIEFERAEDAPELILGNRGTAKVQTERVCVARLILRIVSQTFRLPM
ncbi:MAG: hypothetical protein IT425_12520 [Pirellulales bacterium]|nr:hypothetical protein [Pirellulales bacterium]